jgi:putative flippase GtrA
MIRRELFWFLLIGCSVTLIDYLIYNGLVLTTSLPTGVAKAIGFMIGTLCAYVANRLLTFRHQKPKSGSMLRFGLLYGATLLANVSINGFMLHVLPAHPLTLTTAFVCATIVSATLNFIGMKLFVFPSQSQGASA